MKILSIALFSFKEVLRKKELYVFFISLSGLMAFLFSQTFFGRTDMLRYLKDVGLSMVTLLSIAITLPFASRQIPSEIRAKTIYTILSKPVDRKDVILGKYLGSIFISFFAFSLFFLAYTLVVNLRGGHTGVVFLQTYIFSLLLLSLLCAFSIFFSIFLTTSVNITATVFLYLSMHWFSDQIGAGISESTNFFLGAILNILYFLVPHFQFYDLRIRLVHDWGPLPLWIVLSLTLYTLVYVTVLLTLAVRSFNKKAL